MDKIYPSLQGKEHTMEKEFASFPHQPRKLFGLAPWLVIGISLILGLTILSLAVKGAERERLKMSQNLMDRANALIRVQYFLMKSAKCPPPCKPKS